MCIACGFPKLNHDDAGNGDAVETGSVSTSAGQPVGTIAQLSDYLINGYWQYNGTVAHHWASNTITYNFGNLNATEQAIASAALDLWDDVANISFVQTTGTANINFNHDGSMQAFASGFWDGAGTMLSATIDISSNWVSTYGTQLGTYSYQTYIHEIGHALGLGHQGAYNGSATYGVNNVYANDTWQYSVMSYFAQSNYDGASYRFVMSPQMADIFAIGSIYGAANATRADDTVYGFHATAGAIYDFSSYATAPALTLYDNGGTDTLDASGYSQSQIINLTGGSFSNIGGLVGNIGIYAAAVIENAIGGAGNDTIIGNGVANKLKGNGGNDVLNGGDGSDMAVYSGLFSDYLLVNNADGTWTVSDLRVAGADGIDTLINLELLQFADQLLTIGTAPPTPPANDAPIITSGAQSVSLMEWADRSANETANTPHAASGSITYTDANATDTHTVSFSARGAGYLGTFSLDMSNIDSADAVGWSFVVSDSAIDYLKANQTLTQAYDVMIDDGHGGSVVETVTISLIGADDAVKRGAGKGGKSLTNSDVLGMDGDRSPWAWLQDLNATSPFGSNAELRHLVLDPDAFDMGNPLVASTMPGLHHLGGDWMI